MLKEIFEYRKNKCEFEKRKMISSILKFLVQWAGFSIGYHFISHTQLTVNSILNTFNIIVIDFLIVLYGCGFIQRRIVGKEYDIPNKYL